MQVDLFLFTFVIYITSVIVRNVLVNFLSILIRFILAYLNIFMQFISSIYEFVFVCNLAETFFNYIQVDCYLNEDIELM
jgi:hypothetical protein